MSADSSLYRPAARNVLLLIGSSGVGKSTIGQLVQQQLDLSTVDIDDQFRALYGDIKEYAHAHGWPNYFEKQSELVHKEFNAALSEMEPQLLVLPASALCHDDYADTCNRNRELILGNALIICVLADEDPEKGARVSCERQEGRGYEVSRETKIPQYHYQSAYYTSIADFTVVSDASPEDAADLVIQYISRIRRHGAYR